MGYDAMKSAAQSRATATGRYLLLRLEAFGWATRALPRPSLQFGSDLDGELISPARCVWAGLK